MPKMPRWFQPFASFFISPYPKTHAQSQRCFVLLSLNMRHSSKNAPKPLRAACPLQGEHFAMLGSAASPPNPKPSAALPTATLELQCNTQYASDTAITQAKPLTAKYLLLHRRPSVSTPYHTQSPSHEPSGGYRTMRSPIDFRIKAFEAP